MRLPLLLLFLAVCACESSSTSPAVAVRAEPVIYGEDNREELYQVESDVLQERLARSVVAIVRAGEVDGPRGLQGARPFGERIDLCATEPFADQPSAALCTGVLVDWDLILTAGHCMRVFPISDLRAVFGWSYRASGELGATPDSIYALSEIAAERSDPKSMDQRVDYAFVRLAHAVPPPFEPMPIALVPARDDQRLVVAGSSFGLPLKVDRAATVRDTGAPDFDVFVADSDTSHGASGGPALDERHALLGVLSRGDEDLAVGEGGCFSSVRQPVEAAAEEFTYAASALAGLCEEDPSDSLCRSDCGDPCSAAPRAGDAPSCATSAVAASAQRSPAIALAALLVALLVFRTVAGTFGRARASN